MAKYVWMGIGLQLVMVTAGHFWTPLLNLSGVLGTTIPFLLGIWYGAAASKGWGEAAKGGFAIGFLGAAVGAAAAILMGHQSWIVLTFAPLSSGVTGVMGGALGRFRTRGVGTGRKGRR